MGQYAQEWTVIISRDPNRIIDKDGAFILKNLSPKWQRSVFDIYISISKYLTPADNKYLLVSYSRVNYLS